MTCPVCNNEIKPGDYRAVPADAYAPSGRIFNLYTHRGACAEAALKEPGKYIEAKKASTRKGKP